MDAQAIRPSRWWYGAAALIFVAGTGASVAILVRVILGMNSGFQRLVVPGQGEISIKDGGSYQVFYEHHSVIGDRVFMTGEDYPNLECQLAPKGSSAKVPLAPAFGTTTYELGGHAGKAILGFRVDRPGVYVLSAHYPAGRSGPDIVLAVGQMNIAGTALTIFGSIAGILASFFLAVVIVIVTAVKRSKAKSLSPATPS